MSMRLPAALVVLVKSLNCISVNDHFQRPRYLLEILSSLGSDTTIGCENPILRLSYELLCKASTRTLVDCFWHSLSLFENCGCIYYQELITHWILEGYFDPVRSVTKAYQDGHFILMELMNRGFLKVQEDNMVMPEVAIKNLIDTSRRGFLGRSRLRLSRVYGGNKKDGLGKINQVDDIIEAGRVTRNREKITTILVGGNDLRHESLEKFFEKLKDLEILGLFGPRLASFVPSLSKLTKLRVLVIRDCDLLKNIEELKALQGLHVLEVSGASFLKEIPDDFFTAMPDLQSLHLSVLQIKSSPSSISKLKGLRCLIIRDCPVLEDLPEIHELVNLEAVDVSGARGLQTCFDKAKGEKKNKSKNRNFYHLQQLQLLDLSESQIERLPLFHDAAVGDKLHSVTRLLLRNCRKLIKLPSLKPLSGLQILDLSGTSSLAKMLDVCFEDKRELRVLNLSGTNLGQLPSTIEELSSLNKLLLKDSKNLEVIPNISKLINLEVIDVSGCTKLQTIEGSFEDMHYLREIDLTDTKVMTLPELPTETKVICPKRITLADGSVFKGEKWSEITDTIKSKRSDKASSSKEVVKFQEISETESEKTSEIQPHEPHASECTGKGDDSKERFCQVLIDMALYTTNLSSFDSESHTEVLEITNGEGGFTGQDKEALANVEFVSFVDSSSTRLASIFNEIRLVKGCWLKMCKDIEYLFSGVEEERLGSLEILSITNLRLLDSICSRGFKNLKKLSIDCCPNIKMLFPYASQLPSSLEVLHIKFCVKLEKVFKEGEVSTLTTLCLHELPVLSAVGAKLPNLKTFKVRNCPKLENLFKEDGDVSTLTTLCLYDLPLLSVIGTKLPNLKTLKVRNCPKLENVFEEEGEVSTLTTLCLLELPMLTTIGAKLPNLKKFKVRNCPNLNLNGLQVAI
ncbi:unnamed protein product [Microthlaspi erraticum]|uniref:Disease resistance protein At4g27190-like leucine-rich repeats domain-containing protein n=1 Tax=Microthlaspi erraticum TaxID=1685480 RepID=A0A6D2HH29_9BRAS|nr:unnamed protein product [Microthlaspi erraticum]